MIIIVSNRDVVGVDPHSSEEQVGDEKLFGDNFNAEGGPNELRVATAKYTNRRWRVTLLPDEQDGRSATDRLFEETLKKMRAQDDKTSWVTFIHGFNQSFEKNLKKCKELEDYGVNVVAFSWPSNPGPNGGFFKAAHNKREEYRKARRNARLSITACDRFVERLVGYTSASIDEGCRISINLLAHSLGNYLFQKTVEDQVYDNNLRIFDNIILHQADVDNAGHANWVDLLGDAKRVYVTLNELDIVLKMSTVVNGRRLGNTISNLEASLPVYVDFSYGEEVDQEHRLFRLRKKNPVIGRFFRRAFNGRQAETVKGLVFDPDIGAYLLEERPGAEEPDE